MYKCIIFMFSDLMSMTFSVEIFTVCIYVLACVRLYICMYISMYVFAADVEEHQWYFRMNLSMFTNNVRICIYVCMYVIYFLQFMVVSIILTRVFFISCAYREEISDLQHGKGMWPRLRGYCRRGPTLLTIGTG